MTPANMTMLLAVAPVDMRCSFDGLARAAQDRLGRDARSERAMFIFVNRRRDMLKILWRDETGWCLLAKRLDESEVFLPKDIPSGAKSIAIDTRALVSLLDGVVRRRKETAREVGRSGQAALTDVRSTVRSTKQTKQDDRS